MDALASIPSIFMSAQKRISRFVLLLTLFAALCAGTVSTRPQLVEAKPLGANALDVIISEVAWGGTAANSADEWIELYNTTSSAINLSGWTLNADDGDPVITLAGTIPANGYFLLENGDDNTISNIFADQIFSGSLNNNGEVLRLKDNSATQIDTANISGGGWDGGSGSPNFNTMERISSPYAVDAVAQWTSQSVSSGGLDAIGNALKGTPRNSKIDLSLLMNVDNPTPSVGNNITYTLTITNHGLYPATNISVLDAFPAAGIAYISNTVSFGTTYNNLTGIWSVGTLAPGASATLNITANITAEGAKTNRAEIWTVDQFDPDSIKGNGITTEDDYAFAKAVTPSAPKLNISNTVNNTGPNIGANIVFTITVTNPIGQPYAASNVVVDAQLPVGLTYISSSSSSGLYDSLSGVWSVGSIAVGANASLILTAKVISSGTINYLTTVISDEYGDNSATATVTPNSSTQANLKLEQTWVRSTSAADTAIITLKVTNQDAANTASNVQVRDILPTGLTYVSHTSGKNYSSSSGIWAVGTVLPGNANAVSLDITVKVSASGTSTTNFAEIWLSDQFDPNSTPGNGDVGEDDDDSKEVTVADLSLIQTADISGTNAVFTIKVTNSGPDDATNVKVSNSRLNDSSSYIFVSSSSPSYSAGIWNIGSLANGATVTLVVTTTLVVPNDNLAEISTVDQVDPDSLPNNSSRTEDDDAVSPSADLSLAQTISSPSPYQNSDINSNVTFHITLSNAGFANATNVEVKDLLPSGLTYVSHTSGQTYSSSSGIWSVGSLPSGSSISLDIIAKVTTFGIRTNWAEVWKSGQSDPDSNPGDGSTVDDDDASQTITSYRSVIFNEIAWAGTTASVEDEWIELYNPSDTEINIAGWQIRKNSCSGPVYITLNGKVSKDGYFLLERGDTTTDNTTVSDVAASEIYLASTTPLLDDAGETLFLCDNFNNYIDTANADGMDSSPNAWPAGSNSGNRPSMERLTNTTEKDSSWGSNNDTTKNGLNANGGVIYGTPGKKNSTGNTSSGSTTSSTATPIPTSTPVPPPIVIPPRPIINEILARPGFDWNQDGSADVFDEFIEIKNLTAISISLSGWRLDKFTPPGEPTKSFSLPAVTLKPGERVVFYSKDTNLMLSDGGETIRLINSSGKIYDAFTYDLARVEDRSFCRLPDGNPGNDSWYEDCIPTPLLSNTREGKSPTSPDNAASEVCNLPDTIPLDFFIPECRGYGADIWNPFYWDQLSGFFREWLTDSHSKWDSFIE